MAVVMLWLVWLLAINACVCRWFWVRGIAEGRLLERVEQREAQVPERQLHVVRDDPPGAA